MKDVDEYLKILTLTVGDYIWGMMYKMLIGCAFCKNHKVNKGE